MISMVWDIVSSRVLNPEDEKPNLPCRFENEITTVGYEILRLLVMGSKIVSVAAREVLTWRGHPGIEAVVRTDGGAVGKAVATGGQSFGEHETKFVYDGGPRWGGKGMLRAVETVEKVIAPALVGIEVTEQRLVDMTLIALDGTPDKSKLGGNCTACVSAAVLKAAANQLRIPLYRYIGGVNACILPIPGSSGFGGSDRYGGGQSSGGKPSVTFYCFGFDSFSEALYASWVVSEEFQHVLAKRFNLRIRGADSMRIPPNTVKDDRELWDAMTDAIENAGYTNRVGIQADVAAGTYYDEKRGKFIGLFSGEEKTREDLIELYKEAVSVYPFVVLEDPLDEDDFEGHAILTKELGIEIVGDDLFATSLTRLQRGIEMSACNTMLLKVNQVGTISEAFDSVQLAYRHGYGVMPCSSRGEGEDIADYAVGLGTGQIREGGIGTINYTTGNRLLEIEAELDKSARFLGKAALKGK